MVGEEGILRNRPVAIGVKVENILQTPQLRLDASYYAVAARRAEDILRECGCPLKRLGDVVEDVFNLGRFRRIWVDDPEHGWPYLSPTELLYFKQLRKRFISKKTRNAEKFFVKEGWIVLTCSGTVGRPVYVTKPLTEFFLTHDLIRIVPREPNRGGVLPGYLYAYLSSDVGKALVTRHEYGMTVPHVEPHHVREVPVPILPIELQESIHTKIVEAWRLRTRANELEDEAIRELEKAIGQLKTKTKQIEARKLGGAGGNKPSSNVLQRCHPRSSESYTSQ